MVDGKSLLAHRLAYALANGPIPPEAILRHICDVPACVRPDHLVPGTHEENMRDRKTRKRDLRRNLAERCDPEVRSLLVLAHGQWP